jgi:hypothetical protein
MRKMTLALAATVVMMLTDSADVRALTGLASPATATSDDLPIVAVTCPGAGRRDRCPAGLYLACTPDKWCACISCFAFRRYPNDDYWYHWHY